MRLLPCLGLSLVTHIDESRSIALVTLMVLSNAERQARYRERLKAAAARADPMTPERFELLNRLRLRNVAAKARIEMLRSGVLRLHETTLEGQRDVTNEALARELTVIAENERILAMYDPDDLTSDEPGSAQSVQ